MNKKILKNLLWGGGTLIALGLSYWFCRFVVFNLHGMKQLPSILGVVAFMILVISLFLKKHCLSASAVLGYIGGFAIAFMLNSDGVDAGGARTNNLWIIWTATLLACIVVGILCEIVLLCRVKKVKCKNPIEIE